MADDRAGRVRLRPRRHAPHVSNEDRAARFLSFTSGGNASGFFQDVDREVGDTLDVGKMLHIANRHAVQVVAPPTNP
jgi:hypothetical protein